MNKRVMRPGNAALTWLSVLLIVFGSLSWLPAAAQDATPGDIPAVETAPDTEPVAPEPTLPPATDPPASVPTLPPAPVPTEPIEVEEPAARTNLITTLAAPQVTGITLTCAVAGTGIDGAVVVSDPQPSTIVLQLVTTDVPAIGPLQELGIDLVAGQDAYDFEAELEANDVVESTTLEVVVIGPDGSPVSNAIPVQQASDGTTTCIPEGTSSPTEPTSTEVTGTAPATITSTATATSAPVSSVGRVSNTGSSNLRCRAEPNTSSGIVALLPAGASVEVRGAAVNGWVPVRCSNQDGWVSAGFLVITTAPTSTGTPVATATVTTTPAPGTSTYATVSNTGGSNLRCRTAPNATAAIITLLPSGMRVEARGAAVNGWLPVRCGGQDGWVSAAYMVVANGSATPTATATTTPVVTATPAPGGSSAATVSGTGGAGVRCRTAPVSGAVITVLPELARVEVTGSQQNGWAPVRCAGQAGWVSATFLMFNVGTGSGSGEIWMDINLSTQYMVVYQGDRVLNRTYVSTGRPGFDTPTGTYYINRKVPVKDMTGTLGGEYYYVNDVPNVMYFTNRGHAIHGAYWHNNFGYRMSHGCVNLPLNFASWLYSITPMGARVRIHY